MGVGALGGTGSRHQLCVPTGPEVLLPDPRPPLLRHGVRQRGRGRVAARPAGGWPSPSLGCPFPSTGPEGAGESGLRGLRGGAGGGSLRPSHPAPAALLPPVPGARVPRGPGPLLRRRDRVRPALPALREERRLPRPQGGRAGRRGAAGRRGGLVLTWRPPLSWRTSCWTRTGTLRSPTSACARRASRTGPP